MLKVKMQDFSMGIDLIEGKTINMGITLYSDNIEDIIELQRQFESYRPAQLFRYISDNIDE